MNLFSNLINSILNKSLVIGTIAIGSINLFSFNALAEEKPTKLENNICFNNTKDTFQICKSEPLGFSPNSLTKSFTSQNLVELKESPSSINTYIQQPEPSTDYGSYIISILALLASIGIPLWQRSLQQKDSQSQTLDSINEGFWIREVVMPQINSKIFNLCSTFRNRINLNKPDFTISYRDELLPLLNELRDSFSLFKAFPNASGAIQLLEKYCDDFDDDVTDHLDETISVRRADVYSFQLKLTQELIKTHKLIS